MKSLPSLIRLAKARLDEKRLVLSDLETLGVKLRADLENLSRELVAESEIAAKDVEAAMTFPAYNGHWRDRRTRILQSIADVDRRTARAREEVTEAYRDVRKYEILQENIRKRERAEAERREQIEMDELGLGMFDQRRRQATT